MKPFASPLDASMQLALALLAIIFLLALFAPVLTPYPASGETAPTMSAALEMRHLPPSLAHPFGTDELGRDVFARSLYGTRISLAVGLAARLSAIIIGGLVGAAAGYYSGRVDAILSRIMEIMLAFPSLLLAIAIGVALGPGLRTIVIAIVFVSWVDVAVLIRAVAASVAKRDFVAAARAIGDTDLRILFRQILPNCASALIVSFSFGIASSVMYEASLSFLGLGASAGSPDLPTWGWMIYTAEYHLAAAPWAAFGPCLLLVMTVLGWNLLGDCLRDWFDVKAELT